MNIKVTASQNRLGATTKKVLTEVGESLGLEEVVVASTIRTPDSQARAMLNNIENGRLIRYRWPGQQVTDLARRLRGQRTPREEIVKAMVAEIVKLSKSGNRVSKHCVSEEEYDKCNVIDISFRTMPSDKVESFIRAMLAREEVVKVIQPITSKIVGYDKAEPALHFEINQ